MRLVDDVVEFRHFRIVAIEARSPCAKYCALKKDKLESVFLRHHPAADLWLTLDGISEQTKEMHVLLMGFELRDVA